MSTRHLARTIVLQTLFEWDFNQQTGDVQAMLNEQKKEFGGSDFDDHSFSNELLAQIISKLPEIDSLITQYAPEWPINQITYVDRNVLRLGIYELKFNTEIPPKVAINEAIELAKAYGGDSSGKFINGVLGAVYKEMGEPGKEQISKKRKTEEPFDIRKLPVEKKGGALVYAKNGNQILFGLVHDVFGYWTISKGGIGKEENEKEATIREIKKEIGLDVEIEEKLGENEYIASHPEKGKSLKKVVYFLAKSEYKELILEKSTGLDGARWFELSAIPELRIYNDIIPLISKAIKIISNKY